MVCVVMPGCTGLEWCSRQENLSVGEVMACPLLASMTLQAMEDNQKKTEQELLECEQNHISKEQCLLIHMPK